MKITMTGRTAAGKIKQDCMIYDGIRGTGTVDTCPSFFDVRWLFLH
jgi:hypothetical protein